MVLYSWAGEREKKRETEVKREKRNERRMSGEKMRREGGKPLSTSTQVPLPCPPLPSVQGTGPSMAWQVLPSGKADQEDRAQDACRVM